MKALAFISLAICFLLPRGMPAAPTDGTSPTEVITRLVANASKKPLGPVENDVTAQTVQTMTALAKDPDLKVMGGSLRESIAAEYNEYTLEGPLTSLYSEGPAALFYGKVKLTRAALADYKQDAGQDNTVGFGDSGGFSMFIDSKVRDDGHVIATFCLVQQQGLWKVHGVYLSNDIIAGANKDFIIRQLSAFAKKP